MNGSLPSCVSRDIRRVANTLFYETKSLPVKQVALPLIPDPLARLKVLLDSSTPIVAIESVEEVRAVRLVRAACAAFILKDLHRHMGEPVVVRRLRDVGQKFSENRRTIVLTSPKIEIPAELEGLVEFLQFPLPDRRRLRQIIDETVARISKNHTLQ